jgi:hypothetical protein
MERFIMSKFRDTLGAMLGVIGMLLLIGSGVFWMVGPEAFWEFYEKAKPVLPYFLTGVGLVVLACFLSSGQGLSAVASGTGPAPRAEPEGKVTCGKCAALNDGTAKFCNQCGAAVGGQ